MIYKDVLEAIGNTPIIKLNNISKEYGVLADIYIKYEAVNPGGSIKDRIALNMFKEALNEGKINAGTTLIEPTSGNTGIGIGMIAAAKGYKLILVMPENMSEERKKILSAYGAELVLTPKEKGMQGAVDKAKEISENTENSFIFDQFKNKNNPDAHRKATAKEIISDFPNGLDYFVAGIGTGGTITGVGEVLKDKIERIQVIGVEPYESPLLTKGEAGPHKIQGIGANFVPETLNLKSVDEVVDVKGDDALDMARKLAKHEGIISGISGGANVFAAIKLGRKQSSKGKMILAILPDSGERYLSTELFE